MAPYQAASASTSTATLPSYASSESGAPPSYKTNDDDIEALPNPPQAAHLRPLGPPSHDTEDDADQQQEPGRLGRNRVQWRDLTRRQKVGAILRGWPALVGTGILAVLGLMGLYGKRK